MKPFGNSLTDIAIVIPNMMLSLTYHLFILSVFKGIIYIIYYFRYEKSK